jgi:hypothetical protein
LFTFCSCIETAAARTAAAESDGGAVMAESEVPWYVSLIVSWLPLLTLLVLWWYIGRQFYRGLFTKDGRSIADVFAELADELKRRNDSANPTSGR